MALFHLTVAASFASIPIAFISGCLFSVIPEGTLANAIATWTFVASMGVMMLVMLALGFGGAAVAVSVLLGALP